MNLLKKIPLKTPKKIHPFYMLAFIVLITSYLLRSHIGMGFGFSTAGLIILLKIMRDNPLEAPKP